jgi:hypothetical protein
VRWRERKVVRIIQPISSLGITAAVEAATAAVQGALDLKADRTDLIGKAAAGANSDITSLSGLATAPTAAVMPRLEIGWIIRTTLRCRRSSSR